MGHRTGIRVYSLEEEYVYYDYPVQERIPTGFLELKLLFEFDLRNSHIQIQLDGDTVEYQYEPLIFHRQPPANVKGLEVWDIEKHGGFNKWGWCFPSELSKIKMWGDLNDWRYGLLRVASTLDNSCHLIEVYDAG
jgi:hypothetical protein